MNNKKLIKSIKRDTKKCLCVKDVITEKAKRETAEILISRNPTNMYSP